MSSTLSEGVRVPDIGSTSWGADVNYNWGLLNTALANISGNVKTDVENTWTAPQTFTETINGIAARAVGDEDGTNIKTALASKAADSAVVHLAGTETISGDKTFTGSVATHNITPETDGTYTLGASTYRWADIQSAGMTCWGTYVYQTGITAAAQGALSAATDYEILSARTTDATANFFYRQQISISSTLTQYALYLRMYDSNGDLTANDAVIYRLTSSGLNVFPRTSGTDNLGTSDNKWKTLNGINPGALSFPANSYVDIDTTGWTAGGTNRVLINNADPTYPGWLFVRLSNIDPATDYCLVRLFGTGNGDMSVYGGHSDKHIMVIAPVPANVAVRVYCSAIPSYCRYYACLGNV